MVDCVQSKRDDNHMVAIVRNIPSAVHTITLQYGMSFYEIDNFCVSQSSIRPNHIDLSLVRGQQKHVPRCGILSLH